MIEIGDGRLGLFLVLGLGIVGIVLALFVVCEDSQKVFNVPGGLVLIHGGERRAGAEGVGGRIILTSRYKSQRFPSKACDSPPVLFEGKESRPSSQAGHLPRGKCGIYLRGKPNPATHTLRPGLSYFSSAIMGIVLTTIHNMWYNICGVFYELSKI